MKQEIMNIFRQNYMELCDTLFAALQAGESADIDFFGEDSQFMRFNHGKVRQSGLVHDAYIALTLMSGKKRGQLTFPFSGNPDQDKAEAMQQLDALRRDLPLLPDDPWMTETADNGKSDSVFDGAVPDSENTATEILSEVQDIDFTGIYAGGSVMRAMRNSAGTNHWFSTRNYSVDFSMITENEKMVKGTLAGNDWNRENYLRDTAAMKESLDRMKIPSRTVKPGKYRVYLAPAAVADLLHMFSWNGISSAAIQQKSSALLKLAEGRQALSDKFTLKENFSHGFVPRFNERGEMSAEELLLIDRGKLVSGLTNARTARKYGLQSNAANNEESLRSPEIRPGTVDRSDILSTLQNGLYINNLHYLNWSDLMGGRITGMTRYACFLVENGSIVAPIENMRFDDTLYHFFGDKLSALTSFQDVIPETHTYFRRELGASLVPGIFVDDFTFNL